MDKHKFSTALSENRQTVLSLAVTVLLLGSLFAVATPSSAIETTLTGPDEVDRNDRMTVTATLNVEDNERIPVEGFVLKLRPRDGQTDEALRIAFAPDGTVLSVTPEDGTINNGDIRIDQFVESLTITPTERDAPYGYGPRTGDSRDFGYGYGYGYAPDDSSEFAYEIAFDATALDRTSFVGQFCIDTGEESAFTSDEFTFDVTKPDNDRGKGASVDRDDTGGADGDDRKDRRPSFTDRFLNLFDGRFAQLIGGLLDSFLSTFIGLAEPTAADFTGGIH